MIILGIETSCDETGAAVIEAKKGDKKINLLSNVVASSLPIHIKTGGIIPENAARQQIKYIIPVIKQALSSTRVELSAIDAIAVTIGPGLIGSLLIGVETAKTLAFAWNKPIIPVNHLIGHIYANFIESESSLSLRSGFAGEAISEIAEFPAIALIVSGGHTDLLLMKNYRELKWLGGTRDDAAGEAFDKIGRLLELPYPGGPSIEKASEQGNAAIFKFPRPMIDSNNLDFSFSGLKTAVFQTVQRLKTKDQRLIANLSASVQQTIIDVIITKTLKAAERYKVKSIIAAGGVSANQKLRDEFRKKIEDKKMKVKLFFPEKKFCTDNAAMIATAAFFNYKPIPWQKITANPELYFD
ncbi:MAG: tRNA (adenosine(37)-N6)-threonylcarbamoyltransferase complex transferase subunit TsaD [bacterium]|nr:tRNA (adenosine(37)-N6)-threonylcarbamoyltransferase complex transferase subunit TsaD [bacterium]